MVVTAAAFEAESQEGCAKRVNTISDILDAEFFRDTASFVLLRVEAIESRREDLISRRVRQ